MKPEISAFSPAPLPAARRSPENAPQTSAKFGEAAPQVGDGPAIVAQLHADYCRYSSLQVRMREGTQRAWWDLYVDRGRDLEALRADIKLVCIYLRSQIERDKRNPGALRLANLLQPDQFESDVAEAQMMRGKATKKSQASRASSANVPPGWRAWLEDQYPTKAPDYRDRPFTDLPDEIQALCRAALDE